MGHTGQAYRLETRSYAGPAPLTVLHAHSLSELPAPREVDVRYADVWDQQQVDRFYGQHFSDEQIAVFRDYWEHATQRFDRPSWAVALFLLLET